MKHILTAGIVAVMTLRALELTNNYILTVLVAIANFAITTVAVNELLQK